MPESKKINNIAQNDSKNIDEKINKSILKIKREEILLKVSGVSLESCFGKLFDKLKVVVYNTSKNMLVQMDTEDIILKKHTKTKKALTLGKDKYIHEIEALMIINKKYLDI